MGTLINMLLAVAGAGWVFGAVRDLRKNRREGAVTLIGALGYTLLVLHRWGFDPTGAPGRGSTPLMDAAMLLMCAWAIGYFVQLRRGQVLAARQQTPGANGPSSPTT